MKTTEKPTTSSPFAGSPDARRMEELGRIILAYSEVTDKLQQSHERLESTVLTLREELSDKSRELERRNRLAALGEMAAGMAHEIRNPLGGIQLYASLLAQDIADRPASLEIVRKIHGGVKRLEALVSQVLQFTREMTANVQETDLAEVIQQACDLAAPALRDSNTTLELSGPTPLIAKIDPLLLGQAILNLALNAVEAMPRNGCLRICWAGPDESAQWSRFRMTVEDTGAGVPARIMDRIFNPFFTTRESGTGLGLAIVHRVVEAHEGSICVTNREHGGARFEIRV